MNKLKISKMKQLIKLTLFLIGIVVLLSCESQLDTFDEYAGIQNKYVIGAPLSIEAITGDQKAKIEFVIPADPRIAKAVITWEDLGELQKVELDVVREVPKIDTIKVDIAELAEGIKNFELTLYDKDDDASKSLSTVGFVYGPEYVALLVPRRVGNIVTAITEDPSIDKATIQWSPAIPQIKTTFLKWNDNNGEEHKVEVDSETKETVLINYDSESEIYIESIFLPEENALDEFTSQPISYGYPVIEVFMDKTLWQYVNLGNDTPVAATGWGNWAEMWDGNYDNLAAVVRQHTLRPFSISIDLGVEKVLTEFKWTAKAEWALPVSPREYEIWGIDDITNAETTVILTPETLADWKSEMVEKGWTQLIDFSHAADEKGALSKKIEKDVKSRYVRVVVKETYAAENPDTVVGEFDFKCYK